MVHSIKIQPQVISNNLTSILSQIKERFPFLHYVILVHFLLLAFTVVSMFIDDRQLMGINVWIKPTKFIISAIAVLWTMAWYFMAYPFKKKTATFLAVAAAILMLIENIVISTQAWRGVQSHYNMATAFDGLLFGLMGWAIGIFTVIAFWLFVKSFSSKLEFSTTMKWSFRIAWFSFLFASAVGGSMIAQQAHNVGVADGGNGIPFLNWSTEGGDLRIAHFFGLHAIQIIPLFVYFISKKIQKKNLATILSIAFALLYLGLIVFTFYQAKAGQPII